MNYAEAYTRCFGDRLGDLGCISGFLSQFAPESSLVELGSGSGRIAKHIVNHRLKLIESDSEMIARLKRSVGLSHEIIKRERFRLPLASGSTDGLFLTANSICEMMPISFTLAEISRALKDGGRLHFLNENPKDLRSRKPFFTRPVPNRDGEIYRVATRPSNFFGQNAFVTILEYENQIFTIHQIFPDWADLQKLARLTDLSFVSAHADINGSETATDGGQFFNLVFRKNPSRQVCAKFEGLLSFYEKMSEGYDEVAVAGKYTVPSALVELLKEERGLKGRALELGCANGYMGRFLKQHGFDWDLFGIDFSRSMVNLCRESAEYEAVLQADLNDGIPVLEEELFDIVIAAGVSEFVSVEANLVGETARVLRPGGLAAFSFEKTNENSLPKGEIQGNGVVKFHYSESQVREIFLKSGFEIVKFDELDAYISPTLNRWIPYYLVVARKK